MTQLTEDDSKVFPPDYASIVPNEVVQAVSSYEKQYLHY